MSKQILNREKVLGNFLQNLSLSQVEIVKLIGVAQSQLGFILQQYKERRSIERKVGSGGKRKGFKDKFNGFQKHKITQIFFDGYLIIF